MTYMERLRYRLRMIWLGLTVKPMAGGEETEEEKAAREKAEAEAKEKKEAEEAAAKKPPWEKAGEDFNPERAWKLIEGLRGDVDKLKTRAEEAEKKVSEHEDASKTEQEKAAEAAAADKEAATKATAEAARLRVALKKGLNETQAKRLVGETEEDLEKDADELLESFKSDDGGEEQESRRRPRERLRPGAVPDADADGSDPATLAGQVSRGY